MHRLSVVDGELMLHAVGHVELGAGRLVISPLHVELVVHGVLHEALHCRDL